MKMLPPEFSIPLKRRGRPSISDQGTTVQVGVSIPADKFDELCRRALREGVSVPEIIRRDLQRNKNP